MSFGGRPKTENPKSKNIVFRVTENEYFQISEKAQRAGKKISGFIRCACLGKRINAPVSSVNIDTYTELGRIGNNLNQIAHKLNSGVASGVDPLDIHELQQQIHKLRNELLGD